MTTSRPQAKLQSQPIRVATIPNENTPAKLALKLNTLPMDVLVEIFKSQDSIGGCLHLLRCCRRLSVVLDMNRLVIMNSVITRSQFHKHDVKICRFSQAYSYWDWASKNIPEDGGVEVYLRPPTFHACLEADLTPTTQDVWLDGTASKFCVACIWITFQEKLRGMDSEFFDSLSSRYGRRGDVEEEWVLREQRDIDREGRHFRKNILENSAAEPVSPIMYQRFYLALTRCCHHNEATRLAKVVRYRLLTEQPF